MKTQLLAVALLLFATEAFAQQSEDYRFYSVNSGSSMLLFRGRQGMTFSSPVSGTHFLHSPEFQKGCLRYNGKLYEEVLLNLDVFNHELLIRERNGITNIQLSRDYVEWFEMEGSRYENLRALGYENAPEGFFELLFDGSSRFFRRVDKEIQRDLEGSMWKSAGYVYDKFVEESSFYLIPAGSRQVSKVSRKNAVLKLFGKQRKELAAHMRRVDRDSAMDIETYVLELLRHMEEQ